MSKVIGYAFLLLFSLQVVSISCYSQTLKYKRVTSADTTAFFSKTTLFPFTDGYNCLSEAYVTGNSLCLSLVKVSNDFEVLNQKVYKPDFPFSENNTRDLVTGTVADTDGFMLGGGMIQETAPYYHPFLTRMDSNFDPVWSVRFENLPGYFSTLPALFSESGNFTAYYSTTIPYESVLIVKGQTNSSAGISAFRIKSSPTEYYMVECASNSDTPGDHYLGGSINILGAAFLMKLNSNGINFCKKINLANHNDLTATALKPSSNGNIILGFVNGSSGNNPAFVSKFNSSAQALWCKRLRIFDTEITPLRILETSQNDILVVASTILSFKPLLLKFTSSGDLVWAKTYGPNMLRYVDQLLELGQGKFAMTVAAEGLRIIEFDENGSGCGLEPALDLIVDDVSLSVTDYQMTLEPFAVNLQTLPLVNVAAQFQTDDICVVNSINEEEITSQSLKVFPQPAGNSVTITLPDGFFQKESTHIKIYSLNGILLAKQSFKEVLSLKDFTNGSYIIEVASDGKSMRQLLIKAE